MLKNHKLIIDKNCPLCGLYGKCFTAVGLIDDQTIGYYQTVNQKVFDQLDPERAKYEVAFIHPRSGKTIYGVDAFLHILSHKSQLLKWFLHLRVVYFIATQLYRFISYNRQVMSGVSEFNAARDCTPPVNVFYRWTYLILAALFTGLMVNQFTLALDTELGVNHVGWREYAICFGQIFWQFVILSFVNPSKRLDYLGNMSTVSVIGGFLLIPLLIFNNLMDLSWLQLLIGFTAIVGTMFLLHIRRCKRLGLPFFVSISWVIYRTIVLILLWTLIYY